MANNEIKQKIVLEGEKQYRDAIRDAQRNLKTLRSELKAETAEMGANATAQQKAEAKVKSLKKQIEEQEKIVKANRDALAEVREKYGENADAVAKYEQKLNDSRTALANMRNELDRVGSSFQGVSSGAQKSVLETKALADSFGSIAEAAGSMSEKIEGIFSGVVSTIKSAIGTVWGEIVKVAARADDTMDLAAYLGAEPTQVQAWMSAMRGTKNDMSVITDMITKLKYSGKAGAVTEWFGVSDVNFTNDLEYVQKVLQAMYENKDKMKADGTWADAMSAIFGARKVQEVDGILSDWDAIVEGLQTFNVEEGGFGLNEKELQTMADMNVELNMLIEKWEQFKAMVTTRLFGELSLQLVGNFNAALDALNDYMNADTEQEKADALKRFEDEITKAFEAIGEAIGRAAEAMATAGEKLQSSENPYVKALGDLIVGLSDALKWLSEEGSFETVRNVFLGLFGLWTTAEGIKFVNTVSSVAENIATIFGKHQVPGIIGQLASGEGLSAALAGVLKTATVAVTIAALALPIISLFKSLIVDKQWPDWLKNPYKTPGENLAPDADEHTQQVITEAYNNMTKPKNPTTWTDRDQKNLQTGIRYLLTGEKPEEKTVADLMPQTSVETGGVGRPYKKFDVTAEQQAAVEAFWDIWRSGETGDRFDSAYAALHRAFTGNEGEFTRVDEWLDKLMDAYNQSQYHDDFDMAEWMNTPSYWWKTPAGSDGGNSGEQEGTASAIRNIPGAMQRAMSGVKVYMDKTVVGNLVADEVSRQIAVNVRNW